MSAYTSPSLHHGPNLQCSSHKYVGILVVLFLSLALCHDDKNIGSSKNVLKRSCSTRRSKKESHGEPVILAMRRTLQLLKPSEAISTSRSMKKPHLESKSLIPSFHSGQSELCWDKCKKGEKNMKEDLLKDLPNEAWNKEETLSRREMIPINIPDIQEPVKKVKTRKAKVKRGNGVTLRLEPNFDGVSGWLFKAKLVPLKKKSSKKTAGPARNENDGSKKNITKR